jgi:hypothetical protein
MKAKQKNHRPVERQLRLCGMLNDSAGFDPLSLK